MAKVTKKPYRRGVFVGGYLESSIKEFLQRRAKTEHTTVSQILADILTKELQKDRKTGS